MPGSVTYGFIFVLGIVLGSFANVLTLRVPEGRSIMGRSECGSCGTTLGGLDLVPVVSWTVLRAKCRACAARISIQYPLVELVTGVLVAVTWFRFDSLPIRLAWSLFVLIAIPLFLIDLRIMRLPNPLVLTLLVAAMLLLAIEAALNNRGDAYGRALLAGLVLASFYLSLRILSRGGMGMGDVKLAMPLGIYLGFEGWNFVIVGTFLAFLAGAAVGLFLMARGSAHRKTPIPFGPFMLAGAWASLWLTAPAVDLLLK